MDNSTLAGINDGLEAMYDKYRDIDEDELLAQLSPKELAMLNDDLEKEFEISKNYKSELKWFDGVWSRFKPGLGKDKRGASGFDEKNLIKIGKKISTIPENFNVHKMYVESIKGYKKEHKISFLKGVK